MKNLDEIVIRIKADTSRFDNPADVIRGSLPQFWRGNDIRFEIGVFDGDSTLSVSNYSNISLSIRQMTEDGRVPNASTPALMQKSCSVLDVSVTDATWQDGSKEHVAVTFTSRESDIVPGDHWLSIWATTKDEVPKTITLCAGVIRVLEVGGGNVCSPPEPMAIYYTANECDTKFLPQSSVDTNVELGSSNNLIPSQNAVKEYVDGKLISSGYGEINTASNIGSGTGIFGKKSGTDLQFKSLVAGENVTISSSENTISISSLGGGGTTGMANPMTAAADMIIGGTGGAPTRLPKGATGQLLSSSASGIEWTNAPSADATAAFPSGEYIDLTVGASGDTYTVTNDGWIDIVCTNIGTNGWFSIVNTTRAYTTGCNSYSTGRIIYALFPVSKGDEFELTYNNVNFDIFRLIYSKGAL